jgi:hypothetical protein
MAKPSTREGFKDYCLRQLGAPVLEINVDDDQIDDLVDDALQFWQERHFDGTESQYLKYKITQQIVLLLLEVVLVLTLKRIVIF